jgi:uncharacterized protein involved in outer membrane biogenesis
MLAPGTRLRRFALIGAGVLTLLVLVVLLFPWNALRGTVASIASSRLHRDVSIGRLDVRVGWTTNVQLDDVTVANVAWSNAQPMATFPTMILTFRLPQLLQMSPNAVRLVEPNVLLERNAAGDANWRFDGDGVDSPGATFGALDVDKGTLRYRDALLAASIDAAVQTVPASGSSPQSLQFNGRGTLRGEPFQMRGTSEGTAELRDTDAPFRMAIDARAGRTAMRFDGTVVPSQLTNVKGALHLKGPDLSQLYPIVPAPLPWTPPYDLAGEIHHTDSQWIFTRINGTVGDSDLSGDFTVDVSGKRPATIADLTSRKFNYRDLGGFVGIPPGEPGKGATTAAQKREAEHRQATGRVLSDKPFDVAKLRDHDVDLKFKGASFKWGTIPLDNLVTHMRLKEGVMRFEPLDFGIADGHIVSNITLDVTKTTPSAQARIEARNVELKRIFPQLASPSGSAGRFGGRAQFRAQGRSVADLFASADGDAAIAMRGGEASTLQLVLTNLDLARAATLLIGGDETASIHCAVAAFHAKSGVVTPELFVIDTSAELLTGYGSIDFREEKYDLHLKADSKKPSILALKGPVVIGGTFKTPAVRPEIGPLAARIGASVGLGALAGPLALLPLIDLGDAPDANCKSLYQDARLQTGTTERIARPKKATRKSQVTRAAN